MTPAEVIAATDAGAVVVDLRPPRPFATEHLPGAISIQFNRADLAERMEMVLPKELRLILHSEPEAIARSAAEILEQAGFKVLGTVEGGLKGWRAAGRDTASLAVLDVDQLAGALSEYQVIDAREGFEYRHGHIAGSRLLPSMEAWSAVEQLPAGGRYAVVCGDQVRSALVASVLSRRGLDATLVMGGMVDWTERGYPLEKGAVTIAKGS